MYCSLSIHFSERIFYCSSEQTPYCLRNKQLYWLPKQKKIVIASSCLECEQLIILKKKKLYRKRMEEIDTIELKPVYNCRRCKMNFTTKRESLLHRKTVHEKNPSENKYACEVCDKRFANPGNMYRHLKGHNEVKPHLCKICDRGFAQAANLQRHLSVHNGERPFACQICDKSFTQQGNLRRHELIHTGEKPFRCKRCGRMFSQRVNLKKHVMLHQGYKPYNCDICHKSFLQVQNYKKHMERHEEISEMKTEKADVFYECAVCHVIFANLEEYQSHEIFCEVASEEQIETTTELVETA